MTTPAGADPFGTAPAGADPFGTAALREAALTTWRRDPSRLRQDANLEEDHARGYYRDRVVVELAQNAADAAAAAGQPGRLLLRLTTTVDGAELLAANTGAPLTADGVAALASMRASAKRDGGQVGRFGVGFAAVRSVSDEITVATTPAAGDAHAAPDGTHATGVAFSLARTAALLAEVAADQPSLAAEVGRRHGDLPALRLPFVVDDLTVPEGCTTAVTLRLRGPAEVEAVRRGLAEVDDLLLLALPALGEIVVETDDAAPRRLADVRDRWYSVRSEGVLDPALVAQRPVEERERTGWAVTWAVPRRPWTRRGPGVDEPDAATRGQGFGTVHAPTPTDEPCTLPAVLVASFPLDPSRRHVPPGPLTEAIVRRAGDCYGSLAQLLSGGPGGPPWGPHVLSLVPTGLPAGALDGALHEAALDALRRTSLLTEIDTGEPRKGDASQAILGPPGQDEHLLAALAPMVGGLVHVPPEHTAAARVLGVAMRDLADVVDDLPTGGHEPRSWRELYAALAPHAAAHREALAGLPVPLRDGRTARGARGLLLPTPELAALAIDLPGLRIVHPDAAHPVLVTLGATEADAAVLLEQPEVRAAVEASAQAPSGIDADLADDLADGAALAGGPADSARSTLDGVPPVVATVLDLARSAVAARGADVDLPGWLADLPLPDTDGDHRPAADLAVPGSWADGVLDALVPVRADVLGHWGADTLRAVGVRTDLVTVTVHDVVAEPAAEEDVRLDGWGDYLAHLADVLGPGAYVGDVVAVADLDAVADDAWPRLLERVAEDPDARAALLTEVRASAGGTGRAPSYTAWWLREELGAPFAHPRTNGATPFLPPAPDGTEALDDAVLTAVGAVQNLTDLDAGAWDAYLDRWPDDGALAMTDAVALWQALARAAADGVRLAPPESVPALVEGAALMVPADAVVVAAPLWAQVRPVLPAPAELVEQVADLLDLDAETDVVPEARGSRAVATPAEALAVLPAAPGTWFECEALSVDGVDVDWWATADAAWATTTAGLARAFAHAAGQWALRYSVERVLLDPGALPEVLAEAAGEQLSAWDATR